MFLKEDYGKRVAYMKTAAVIAEYNPFHAGHQYHLTQTRQETGADFILAVVSGDFVQRGAPAICNKYARTRAALENGADVVLELPVRYALSSASDFAAAGVCLCNRLGCIDFLSFGSESGNLSLLQQLAALELRAQKEAAYQEQIRTLLKKGSSYPAARAEALSLWSARENPDSKTELTELLKQPNNILGLEYCKALLAENSSIEPVTIKRRGTYGIDAGAFGEYLSAAAIRQLLLHPKEGDASLALAARSQLPSQDGGDLFSSSGLLDTEDFSLPLHYKLLSCRKASFTQYLDCSEDLSDKIVKCLPAYQGVSDFCSKLKSRNLTYSRISRVLMHILLNIEKAASLPEPALTPYGRLLGFRWEAQPLLAQIKKHASIPILSKMADAANLLEPWGRQLLAEDVFAAEIYEAVRSHKMGLSPINEYRQSPIILP